MEDDPVCEAGSGTAGVAQSDVGELEPSSAPLLVPTPDTLPDYVCELALGDVGELEHGSAPLPVSISDTQQNISLGRDDGAPGGVSKAEMNAACSDSGDVQKKTSTSSITRKTRSGRVVRQPLRARDYLWM